MSYKLVGPLRHCITLFTSFFQGNSLLLPPIHLTMKPFVFLVTLVVFVNGRPEPPTGYNYPRPGGSIHQHQISSVGGNNYIGGGNYLGGGHNFGGHQQTIHSGSNNFHTGSNNFQTGSTNFLTGSSSFDGSNFNNANTFNANNIFAGQHGSIGGITDFGSSSSSTHFNGGVHTSGGVTVQKHIYVHVAPPEPEEFRPQRPISVGQAQKHYKIIFIKAPSQSTPTAPTIPLQAQNEEKTLVYVLVKKPEEQSEISIPTAAPTAPSKPEVYFIRYKTKKEGGSAINTIGTSISNVGIPAGPTGSIISTDITGINENHNIFTSVGSHTTNTGSTSSVYGPPGHVSGVPY